MSRSQHSYRLARLAPDVHGIVKNSIGAFNMETTTKLTELDRVEILTLQDNYIDLTATDNSAVVTRAMPLKDGQFRLSVLSEHGFSALIKTTAGGVTHTLLFDTGFSEDCAARNARTLDVNMAAVEAVALSHGHIDHTGGFRGMAAAIGAKGTPLVVHPAAFRTSRYLKMAEDRKIRMPALKREDIAEAGLSLVEADKPLSLLDGHILFLGTIPRKTDFEKGFPIAFYEENGQEKRDPIEDDTSIVLNLKGKGLIVLSGCAHSGIINTVLAAREATGIEQIHVVMGGFHLGGPLFEPIIGRTTEELQKFALDYVIPTHCTGRKAVMHIEQNMSREFLLNMSGTKMTFVA